ncbi:hypothetical protein [Undibacterium sp. TC9W]|uniref:hypothetical protein n=1 Tax=Undibacterium sp. TC9W TaxID=3413053 RepID=UPI003BF048B1
MKTNHFFKHDDKDYEVRIIEANDAVHVKVFCDNKPANGYSYQVSLMTKFSALLSSLEFNPVQHLINTAISDVKNGNWERYVAAATSKN